MLEDRDVGVGIFAEGEELLISGLYFDFGSYLLTRRRLGLAELRPQMIEKSLNPFRISFGNRRVYPTFAIKLKTLR